jgi:hypothetical protein
LWGDISGHSNCPDPRPVVSRLFFVHCPTFKIAFAVPPELCGHLLRKSP